MYVCQLLLAFGIAALVTALELITSKYPRTVFLLKASRSLYVYAAIYGVIGLAVRWGLDPLTQSGTIKLEGLGLSNPWVQSLALGVTIKAFLHIPDFSVA